VADFWIFFVSLSQFPGFCLYFLGNISGNGGKFGEMPGFRYSEKAWTKLDGKF
jgi:hypothetical protein